MIRSSVTLSLVPEAQGGPFVFWHDLEECCRTSKALGFDAVEVFPPESSPELRQRLERILAETGLALAAVGTGAGWVRRKLTLTSPVAETRAAAKQFIRDIIDLAGSFQAPAIIGSMQGRFSEECTRDTARSYLIEGLRELADHAARHGVPLLFEPINRYESNMANRLAQGVEIIETGGLKNVRLLADLFHMNMEETSLAGAFREAARHVGHVHFVDSNRRPAGHGRLHFIEVAGVLREIGYDGFLSAEALPYPDSLSAARATIGAFQLLFPRVLP